MESNSSYFLRFPNINSFQGQEAFLFMPLPWKCQPACPQLQPYGSSSPSWQLAHGPKDLLGLYINRTFCGNLCPTCPPMVFAEKSQGKLTLCTTPFGCLAMMGVELLGLFCRFSACAESRKPMGKYADSGQGFFLSSFKASASCSKFLMTAFHLKAPLALKEANFNSTVSQDNLTRK